MKQITLLSLLILSLFTACKKDNDSKVNEKNYFFSASQNNVSWVAKSIATFTITKDTLNIIGNSDFEQLTFNLKLNKQGQYQIDSTKAGFTYFNITRSAITASYMLDNSKTNLVNIIKIDTTNYSVTGNFNLAFKKISGDSSYPTIVTLTDGKFNSEIITRFSL